MSEEMKEYWLSLYNKIANEDYKCGFGEKLDNLLTRLVTVLRNDIYNSYEGGVYLSSSNTTKYRDNMKAQYVCDLYALFRRIIDDGREDELAPACSLYISLSEQKSEIPRALESYLYPQESYSRDKRYYYGIWYDFISTFTDDFLLEMHLSLYKDLKPNVKSLLENYFNYSSNIMCSIDNWRQRTIYSTIMELIIPYFYKEGYDLDLFPAVMNYVFNNALDLETYYVLNSGDENKEVNCKMIKDYDSAIMARIMEGIKGNNRIIR